MMAAASINIRPVEGRNRKAYDFNDPAQALDALVKMRGDLTGAEVAWYWSGGIWGMVPGEGNRKLFAYNGFSAARFEAVDEGYRMLNRETGVYRDPATGAILGSWLNPYLRREVEVLHRLNDHVNVEIRREGRFSIAMVPATIMGDDVFWSLDMFFFRPSPISRADYPLNVQHDMYQGAELTLYHARREDIENPELTNAPGRVTFSRISQWEPFMEMGNRPGQLIFHAAGKKLPGGAAELEEIDPGMHAWIVNGHREYLKAPKVWQHGTMSQWDAFKVLRESDAAD
jgi:hypothetical protein